MSTHHLNLSLCLPLLLEMVDNNILIIWIWVPIHFNIFQRRSRLIIHNGRNCCLFLNYPWDNPWSIWERDQNWSLVMTSLLPTSGHVSIKNTELKVSRIKHSKSSLSFMMIFHMESKLTGVVKKKNYTDNKCHILRWFQNLNHLLWAPNLTSAHLPHYTGDHVSHNEIKNGSTIFSYPRKVCDGDDICFAFPHRGQIYNFRSILLQEKACPI